MSVREQEYMSALALKLGTNPRVRVWRQNVGGPVIRDRKGRTLGRFNSGPPVGSADLSGCVCPEGWRLEIETKAASTKHTEAQKSFARNMHECGCVYVLARFDASKSLELNVSDSVDLVMLAIERRANE